MDRIGKSMTGEEMSEWLVGSRVMTYKQLGDEVKRGANLDDVLGPYGVLVLLYQLDERHGHWTLVFRRGRDVVECFDSYGYTPDDEFSFVPKGMHKRTNQDYRYLTQLLYKLPYRIEYNEEPLQADGAGIATCGRHCNTKSTTTIEQWRHASITTHVSAVPMATASHRMIPYH